MEKLTKTFDKMGFATDSYLGFLTVSPANLGTGMAFTATQVLDGKKRTKDEEKSLACDLSPYWYDPINTKFSF